MTFTVITNPAFKAGAGFTPAQFKKLDDLYCRAASEKILNYRTVECDFEAGVASYTYYKVKDHHPFARFVIRRAGPTEMTYEVYVEGKGRAFKSGVFSKAYEILRGEISLLS